MRFVVDRFDGFQGGGVLSLLLLHLLVVDEVHLSPADMQEVRSTEHRASGPTESIKENVEL